MCCLKFLYIFNYCRYKKDKLLINTEIETYKLNNNINKYSDEEECLICLSQFSDDNVIQIKCCNCIIHQNCFHDWCIKNKKLLCPICLKEL